MIRLVSGATVNHVREVATGAPRCHYLQPYDMVIKLGQGIVWRDEGMVKNKPTCSYCASRVSSFDLAQALAVAGLKP